MEKEKFQIGDNVKWKNKTKHDSSFTGKIIAVVDAFAPYPIGDYPLPRAPGRYRTEESYVIESAGKYYWPLVKQLSRA